MCVSISITNSEYSFAPLPECQHPRVLLHPVENRFQLKKYNPLKKPRKVSYFLQWLQFCIFPPSDAGKALYKSPESTFDIRYLKLQTSLNTKSLPSAYIFPKEMLASYFTTCSKNSPWSSESSTLSWDSFFKCLILFTCIAVAAWCPSLAQRHHHVT